jgi:hypothetical protein
MSDFNDEVSFVEETQPSQPFTGPSLVLVEYVLR